MNCPSCGHENREGAAFCGGCGQSLAGEQRCPQCDSPNPAGQRFCDSCGNSLIATNAAQETRDPRSYTPKHLADKILQSKSALEGERKQVTVLFADVKGSVELSGQLDPEEWHRILDRFFQILTDGVHRFEGTVNQYTGDGIMALFGAPIAHEDHAQRACYAALALHDDLAEPAREVKREYGLTFSTRMGIHSGEVIVGKIGDDLRMDYTAQGVTVGLAARLEGLASPDTIYLSDASAALVSGYFELDDLGEFRLKGLEEPVRVHQLAGASPLRTRFDVSRPRGLTRFVGRDADMGTLESALEQASAGRGQVVGAVAEAGTGKSRLCFEFLERCRARGIAVHESGGVAHGKNIPFLPMLQVFRSHFRIEDDDDPQTVREKIARRLLTMDAGFRDALPLVFEIFGAPDPDNPVPEMGPDERQRRLFGVLRRATQGEREPRVSLLEDLQWLDATSERFLEEWVDALPGSNTLLLVNFRPEYHADWRQKSWYRQIPLAPLGPKATQELLDDFLGHDPSVVGLGDRIHERTEGNPFFTEEVVQTLIELGRLEGERGAYRLAEPVASLEIPATVRSLLAARIDRLAEREKHVLQAAAVLGKEFSEPILEAVAELPRGDLTEALAALKGGEFLYEESLYPIAEYTFKHPLTQEVALGSQLQDRRRRLHAAAARALEEARADRLDESAALLAHHWEEAGDSREAARWHCRAAEWVGLGDPVGAFRHWQRVRDLGTPLAGDDDEIAQLCLRACRAILLLGGWRLGVSDSAVRALTDQARSLAERFGDRTALATLLSAESISTGLLRGDMRGFYEKQRAARALLGEDASREDRIFVHTSVVFSTYVIGRVAEAVPLFDELIELGAGDPRAGLAGIGFGIIAWGQSMGSQALAMAGRFDEAAERNEQAIRLARKHGLSENLGWALGASAQIALWAGSVLTGAPDPRAAAVESLEHAEDVGASRARELGLLYLACAERFVGNFEAADRNAAEALDLIREEGTGQDYRVALISTRSVAQRELGNAVGALELAREAVDLAERQPCLHWGIDARLALARAWLAVEGPAAREDVEACLERASEWLGESGARAFEPQILEVRAELAGVVGNQASRERELREAHRLYTEMGATGHAKRLAKELGA